MRNLVFCSLFALVWLLPGTVSGSHLAGQDFSYVMLGASGGMYHYRVSLSLIQDCLNGQPAAIMEDNPAFFSVYSGSGILVDLDTSVYYTSAVLMPTTANGSCDSFIAGDPICHRKATFSADFYLPACTTGYTVVYQRCCLNALANILDPADMGVTAFCNIPASGIATYNNNAIFNNYPPSILDLGVPLAFDCSATDPDGDSLSYEICAPYSGANASSGNIKPIPSFGPYDNYTYLDSLSAGNPLGCSPPLTMNAKTGILAGTPNALGNYIVGVCCTEWRHGTAINTVQRVFEFLVVNCAASGIGLVQPPTDDWRVFPNPASGLLTVSSNRPISNLLITNSLGQLVYRGIFATGGHKEVQVDASALPQGLYWVQVNGGHAKPVAIQ